MNEWQKKQKDEQEIDLGRLAKALLHWSWLLMAVAIIFGLTAYLYSANAIDPTYRATFTAYVLSSKGADENKDITVGELNASIGLAFAYGDITTSRTVLQEAANKSGYKISVGELQGKVSISVSETTAILTVHVDDTDPVRACKLANAIAAVAPDRVNKLTGGGTMNIIDDAVVPGGPSGPNNKQNAILGALIGFALAAGLVIVRELVNDKVQSTQELEKRYQIPVVGSIPDLDHIGKSGQKNYYGRKVGSNKQ